VNKIIIILVIFIIQFSTVSAYAYIGPAIALGTLAIILLIILSIIFALISIFYVPIKNFFIFCRKFFLNKKK